MKKGTVEALYLLAMAAGMGPQQARSITEPEKRKCKICGNDCEGNYLACSPEHYKEWISKTKLTPSHRSPA